jgi:hypothetical protein
METPISVHYISHKNFYFFFKLIVLSKFILITDYAQTHQEASSNKVAANPSIGAGGLTALEIILKFQMR